MELGAEQRQITARCDMAMKTAQNALTTILTGKNPNDNSYVNAFCAGLSLGGPTLSWPEIYAKVGALVAQHADDEQRKAYSRQAMELDSLRQKVCHLEAKRCSCEE